MSSSDDNPPSLPSRRRLPWRRLILAAVLCLVALLVFHPPVLAGILRMVLVKAAAETGLRLEVGSIRANLLKPLVFENVRLRAKDAAVSRTAADIERLAISFNWPWQAFWGEKRIVRSVVLEGMRGVFDFRPEALPPTGPLPKLSEAQERKQAQRTLQLLPQFMEVERASMEFLAADQSYYLQDLAAVFSEERLGKFQAGAAEVHAGEIQESFGTLKGVTAWKEGTIYLADLALREDLRVENFQAQLARPGGLALGMDATIAGGSARGDVVFEVDEGKPAVDAALWASDVNIATLAALCGVNGKAEGVLREVKLAFRGVADDPLNGQASLRLVADGFLWNKRGWESLEVGASMNHRRLVVSDFALKQKENALNGNGEITLSAKGNGFSDAPFLLNFSASIKDLGALAALVGPPFDEMGGRMSLSGSVSGQGGKYNGYLSLEASGMNYREHPIESGRVEINFVNTEAQVTQCEFWSGGDYLRGHGTVELAAPHNYSGEIQARVDDVAAYLDLFDHARVPAIYAGAVQLRWQGDGTLKAHSGAFNLSLDDFVSEQTPSGLTGRFAGTYSPQNVYFSGFELEQKPLRFSSRVTLAGSGIKITDGVLRAGSKELADMEVFLPVDPFAVASGKSLQEALHPDQGVYALVSSRGPLVLRDLLRLAGNELPLEGTLNFDLKASGVPSALAMEGKLEGRGLAMHFDKELSPVSRLDASIHAADGRASLSGELNTRGFPPVRLQAQSPFGFVKTDTGELRWMNPDGAISARLEMPKTDLAIFKPLLPKIQKIGGSLGGELTVDGTVAKPLLNGRLAISGGEVKVDTRSPEIGNLNGAVKFDTTGASIEKFTGDIAAGPFEIKGGVALADPSNPRYDVSFSGYKILLARDPSLRLRANVELRAAGDNAGGLVSGSVRLVDGRIYRRLEITPLLVPSPVEEALFVPPRFEGLVPYPFNGWKLDVSISNETPFTLAGNIASGEIMPDLRLTGTLNRPVPLGRIDLKDMRAYLPFTTMTIQNGHLDFVASDPWMPQLDIRGTAEALDYDVQAYAFGPLNERRLILRSDPPLSQEALILLLTTGIAPGVYSGAGFGEAAVGQGGLLLLRAFARQFDTKGVDVDSLINRLQITSVPPQYQGGRATLRGRFQLWKGLSLMSERDSFGFYNAGVTYSLRFR